MRIIIMLILAHLVLCSILTKFFFKRLLKTSFIYFWVLFIILVPFLLIEHQIPILKFMFICWFLAGWSLYLIIWSFYIRNWILGNTKFYSNIWDEEVMSRLLVDENDPTEEDVISKEMFLKVAMENDYTCVRWAHITITEDVLQLLIVDSTTLCSVILYKTICWLFSSSMYCAVIFLKIYGIVSFILFYLMRLLILFFVCWLEGVEMWCYFIIMFYNLHSTFIYYIPSIIIWQTLTILTVIKSLLPTVFSFVIILTLIIMRASTPRYVIDQLEHFFLTNTWLSLLIITVILIVLLI